MTLIAEDDASAGDLVFFAEMYVLFFGLSFHSLFVGFTLGLADGDVGLFLAVLVHQLFEGFALGAQAVSAGVRNSRHLLIIDVLFAASTPIGIGIGLGVKSAIENDPTTYVIVEGTFQSLSGGILVYLGLVHLLAEELSALASKVKFQRFFILGVLIGALVLSVAAIWV